MNKFLLSKIGLKDTNEMNESGQVRRPVNLNGIYLFC